MTASSITTKIVKGNRTVVEGKGKKKVPYEFEVISTLTNLDDLIEFFKARGMDENLPENVTINSSGSLVWDEDKETEDEEEEDEVGQRGKKEIPDSIAGLLAFAFKQKNSQRQGAKAYSEAMNTPDRVLRTSAAAAAKLVERTDATPAQLLKAQLIGKLAAASTNEEYESIMTQIASLVTSA